MQQSQLSWFFSAMGFSYSLGIALTALFSFVMTLVLVIRGRGNSLSGALAFLVVSPVLVAVLGALTGAVDLYQIIVISETSPNAAEVAAGFAGALVMLQVGFLSAVPSFVIATFFLIARALTERDRLTEPITAGKSSGPAAN